MRRGDRDTMKVEADDDEDEEEDDDEDNVDDELEVGTANAIFCALSGALGPPPSRERPAAGEGAVRAAGDALCRCRRGDALLVSVFMGEKPNGVALRLGGCGDSMTLCTALCVAALDACRASSVLCDLTNIWRANFRRPTGGSDKLFRTCRALQLRIQT